MDNDIKIFDPEHQAGPKPCDDLEALAAQTEQLRESGDLTRAKRLGRELAALSANSPELGELAQSFALSLTPEREQHLHVLMVFSGQQALRALLPQLLSEAAITAMNNYLINRSKVFWDTISDGSAFTQYLLAAQGLIPADGTAVGAAFARVCGQEDNPDLRALGAALFDSARELVIAKWEAGEAPS